MAEEERRRPNRILRCELCIRVAKESRVGAHLHEGRERVARARAVVPGAGGGGRAAGARAVGVLGVRAAQLALELDLAALVVHVGLELGVRVERC